MSLGLVELAFPETRTSINDHYRSVLQTNQGSNATSASKWPHLLKVCVSLLRQLHTRDLRRGFCPPNHWVVHTLNLPLDKPTDLEMPRGNRNAPRPFQPIRDFTREDFGTIFIVFFIQKFKQFLIHFIDSIQQIVTVHRCQQNKFDPLQSYGKFHLSFRSIQELASFKVFWLRIG